MSMRSWIAPFLALPLGCAAQGLAPFVTPLDHFMAFERGRFREVEPRKPQQVVHAGDRIVYLDDQGRLKFRSEKSTTPGDRSGALTLIGGGAQVAFTDGTRLGIARSTGSLMLSNDATGVRVTDSLVVWHDREHGELKVCAHNNVYTVAPITSDTAATRWQAGANTLTFHDRRSRTIQVFYRGKVSELCDSSDVFRVSCGGDVVAYWDPGPRRFMVMDHDARKVLEEFAPIDFRAGDGLLAYTDALVSFNLYRSGTSVKVLDHQPTRYWVKDSTVVFVDRGMFWTVEQGRAEVVEEYVPEQWEVDGGSIVYLDLNREIREYHHGRRALLSREARIARFERYGDVVLYRNELGTLKAAWNGRVHEY